MFHLLMIVLLSNGMAVKFDLNGFSSAAACEAKSVELMAEIQSKNLTIFSASHECVKFVAT